MEVYRANTRISQNQTSKMSDTESRPLPTEGPTAGGDELDDLFNYGIDDENDPFADNYVSNKAKERQRNADEENAKQAVDAEVEITRKPRAPRVKLDENR